MSSGFDKTSIAKTLTASDVAYFEAASKNTPCLGGVLSQLPGFPRLALSCVLHSLGDINDIDSWAQQLEERFADEGVLLVRFYLQQPGDKQREQLLERGYRESVELGFASSLADVNGGEMALRYCNSEDDWREYTRLVVLSGDGPDGFDMNGDSYARVSRLKVNAGYMAPYLAVQKGNIVGFINLSLQGDFARGKNLLVHPEYRDQGMGSLIVKAAMRVAREKGARYFGCYAIANEPSVRLYKGLGMVEVTRQSDWSKYLD